MNLRIDSSIDIIFIFFHFFFNAIIHIWVILLKSKTKLDEVK